MSAAEGLVRGVISALAVENAGWLVAEAVRAGVALGVLALPEWVDTFGVAPGKGIPILVVAVLGWKGALCMGAGLVFAVGIPGRVKPVDDGADSLDVGTDPVVFAFGAL